MSEHVDNEPVQIAEGHLKGDPFRIMMEPAILPEKAEKLEICQRHMADGRLSDMMFDFQMSGCHFPESGAENRDIIVQLSCNGISRFRKQCQLTLTQHDQNGKTLTKGTIHTRD